MRVELSEMAAQAATGQKTCIFSTLQLLPLLLLTLAQLQTAKQLPLWTAHHSSNSSSL
jgi:hypothetical protein